MEVSAGLVLVTLQEHVHSLLLEDAVDLVTGHSFLRPRFVGEILDHRRKSGNRLRFDLDKCDNVNVLGHVL